MLVLLVGNFSKILTAETLTKTNHTKPQSNQSMASKSSNVRWPPKPDRHKPHHLPQMICVHSRSCCRAVRQPGGSVWRVRGHMCHMRYMCWEKNLRPQDFISSFSLLKLLNFTTPGSTQMNHTPQVKTSAHSFLSQVLKNQPHILLYMNHTFNRVLLEHLEPTSSMSASTTPSQKKKNKQHRIYMHVYPTQWTSSEISEPQYAYHLPQMKMMKSVHSYHSSYSSCRCPCARQPGGSALRPRSAPGFYLIVQNLRPWFLS